MDFTTIILGNDSNVQTLPQFLGNYSLTLLETFYPFFILLSCFVLIYKGFANGFNGWKSAARETIIYMVPGAIIMLMLSMKYEKDTTNKFFEDTNSYVIVDMINYFVSWGDVFGDAITHKIIYGTNEINNGEVPSFDGFFPNYLKATLEKETKEKEKVKDFIINVAKKEDILKLSEDINKEITNNLDSLVKDLYNQGLTFNHRKTYDLTNIDFDKDRTFAIGKSGNGHYNLYMYHNDKYQGFNKDSGIKFEDINLNNLDENDDKYNDFDDRFKKTFAFSKTNVDDLIMECKNNDVESVSDWNMSLTSCTHKYYVNYVNNKLKDDSIRSSLSLIYPSNFDFETKTMLVLKSVIYKNLQILKEYDSKIEELKSSNKKEVNSLVNKYTKNSLFIRENIKEYSKLYKDILEMTKLISEKTLKDYSLYNSIIDNNLIEDINKAFNNSKYFESLEKSEFVKVEDLEYLRQNYLHLNSNTTSIVLPFSNWNNRQENAKTYLNSVNTKFNSRKKVITYYFNQLKKVLESDLILQSELGMKFDSPYAKVFFSKSEFDTYLALDNKVKDLHKSMLAKTSIEEFDKQIKTLNPELEKEIVGWKDLGKYYGTFKNVYTPFLNNAILVKQLNDTNKDLNLQVLQTMKNLEPSGVGNTVLNGLAMYGSAKVGEGILNMGSVKSVVSAIKNISISDSKSDGFFSDFFGPVLDIFKAMGFVYAAMLFVNVIFPSLVWLFVMITYYLEVSIYLAIMPIGFIFMIFQSHQQAFTKYINMLLGFILMPIILVSMYFVILYIDMLVPMFLGEYLPFFNSDASFLTYLNVAMGDNQGLINSGVQGTLEGVSKASNFVLGNDVMTYLGQFIYTLLTLATSILLLLVLFRANEYMSKVLDISTIGENSINSKENLSKFSKFNQDSIKI
jgi:hypothetical protein